MELKASEKLKIEIGYGQLENGGKRDPEQIGYVDQGNPGNLLINYPHGPNESDQDEQNIDCGQKIVLQSELKRSKSKIK